jgi:hypothetical protein
MEVIYIYRERFFLLLNGGVLGYIIGWLVGLGFVILCECGFWSVDVSCCRYFKIIKNQINIYTEFKILNHFLFLLRINFPS